MSRNCVFCEIVQRGRTDDDAPFVYETTFSVVFEPLNPVTPGHLLVVPRKHVTDFAWSPTVFGESARDAARFVAMRVAHGDEDYNLITSKGEAATQTVRHLHIHLVPRRTGDGLQLPWSTP